MASSRAAYGSTPLPRFAADSTLEQSRFELLVPSAISSWIGWVPEPLFGRIRALVPVTASSVAAPCHAITDEVSGVGQAPRLTALSPVRRAAHSGAAGYIRFYASTGGVAEA